MMTTIIVPLTLDRMSHPLDSSLAFPRMVISRRTDDDFVSSPGAHPVEVFSHPLEGRSHPLEGRSHPMEDQSHPMEGRSHPMDVDTYRDGQTTIFFLIYIYIFIFIMFLFYKYNLYYKYF